MFDVAFLFWPFVFITSIVVLVKSSDWFTEAAERIGVRFGLSSFLIGVTIVAIGTSIPELVSSLIAAFIGQGEIVAGSVIGANIARILLVLGLAAIVGKKLNIVHELISVDLPFLVGSAFIMALMLWDGVFTPVEGLLSLGVLFVYFAYTAVSEERSDPEISKEMRSEVRELRTEVKAPESWWEPWAMLAIAGVLIYAGARFTVQSVTEIAGLLGVGSHIVAVVALGLGTSLPELSVTIAAARHHKAEIAVGNLLGSNIFNSFGVMGFPALFGPLAVPASLLEFALPVMVAATFLYLFITQDKQITKWEGWLLLIFYAFFVGRITGLF
ncbi:calcium/sodium antiporter [Candidatus Woesearchaeota archaeon]|nr:calcium/sodium antiporter [Candidatus Woesearchaeota archaeon]